MAEVTAVKLVPNDNFRSSGTKSVLQFRFGELFPSA